ncbi:glycosyltransferase family 4 protein [Rubritalea spongiae]|uniref:Glycosyltransferase family 4 protein n=1 Tax=Rubritalea spongiae TaxID=430797 RepID=A0ABW5E0V1_9BACT
MSQSRGGVQVLQVGARHHFAIPRMLQEEKSLHSVVTDTCPGAGAIGRVLKALPQPLLPSVLKKWSTRSPRGVALEKIHTSELSGVYQLLASRGVLRDHWDFDGPIFKQYEKSCMSLDLSGVKVIYAMLFEASPRFIRKAKAQGVKVIYDVYITPTWHHTVNAEREKWPEWEGRERVEREDFERRVTEMIELADILLCPGENVVDGLREFEGFDASKVRVLPYGCGIDFEGRVNEAKPGRVLFAGSANLRKGLPYLAEAAKILRERGREYDFRVAGGVDESIRSLPECEYLHFLGRVARPDMKEEFLSADVMAFPSLAEGCAGVVHESLFAGLPVITTKSAGSVIKNEQGGLIIAEADALALADAIQAVVENRELRDRLAQGALDYRERLSEQTWKDGIMELVNELQEGGAA